MMMVRARCGHCGRAELPVRYVSLCQGRQYCSYNSPPGGSTCRCRGLEQRCPLLSAATAAHGGYTGCQPVSELPCIWWTAGLVNARAAAHDTAPILRCAERPGQSTLRSYCRSRRRKGTSSQWYDFGRLGPGRLVRPTHRASCRSSPRTCRSRRSPPTCSYPRTPSSHKRCRSTGNSAPPHAARQLPGPGSLGLLEG